MTTLMADKASTGLPILEHQYSRAAITRSLENALRDLTLLEEMMPDIIINKERMRRSAGAHWAQATDVAGMLVREKGLPWRTAHQIVGILVRISLERGLESSDVTPELLDESSVAYMGKPLNIEKAKLMESLDPVLSVQRRTLYGGPASTEVKDRIPEYEAALSEDRNFVTGAREQVQDGLSQLEAAIDQLIKSI
jgi:argininosuccinate lyase